MGRWVVKTKATDEVIETAEADRAVRRLYPMNSANGCEKWEEQEELQPVGPLPPVTRSLLGILHLCITAPVKVRALDPPGHPPLFTHRAREDLDVQPDRNSKGAEGKRAKSHGWLGGRGVNESGGRAGRRHAVNRLSRQGQPVEQAHGEDSV